MSGFLETTHNMSSATIVPDCLVWKLEEFDVDTQKIDTTVYIFYDKMEHQYVVRGRRRWSPDRQCCCYSFVCEFAHELVSFLEYVICNHNTLNETLYNYTNLPNDSNDVTFEFLNENDHSDYEISGYDSQKFNKKRLLKVLRMLRNVFNYYN